MIEVYSEWAGKCEATSPLLRQLKAEKEYDPSVFVALSCCAESHEMLEEFRGQSLPHFIFFRNGVKKATVKGANVAAMKRYIVDYTPNVPEADDLEENPQLKNARRRRRRRRRGRRRSSPTSAAAIDPIPHRDESPRRAGFVVIPF